MERYKVKRITHYEVVDTEAAEDAPVKVHYNGPDNEFAQQLAYDLNRRAQDAEDAQERIQQEAREEAAQRVISLAEEGRGKDK